MGGLTTHKDEVCLDLRCHTAGSEEADLYVSFEVKFEAVCSLTKLEDTSQGTTAAIRPVCGPECN